MDYARTHGAHRFPLLDVRGTPLPFVLFLSPSPPPHHHLVSARISARPRPHITPTGSPDARYACAHPHELRTPTHAPSRHLCPVSALALTLSDRTTPHVRRSCASGRQAHAGTHARPRSTRRTELDDEGSAGRDFGPVCRGFRVYKHPHLYTHPQQSTPELTVPFPSSPRPVRASSPRESASLPFLSPQSPTSSATRGPTASPSFPKSHSTLAHRLGPHRALGARGRSPASSLSSRFRLRTKTRFRISGYNTQRDRAFCTGLNSH
jgi:hypothetical protein